MRPLVSFLASSKPDSLDCTSLPSYINMPPVVGSLLAVTYDAPLSLNHMPVLSHRGSQLMIYYAVTIKEQPQS